MMTEGTTPGPGSTIAGRYRLETIVGTGGFGAVYRATDLTIGQVVALKVLTRDAIEVGARFKREAELAMRLSHGNTVRTFDAGVDPALGFPYIVLELLEGASLDAVLKTQGPVAFRRAADIAIAVLG